MAQDRAAEIGDGNPKSRQTPKFRRLIIAGGLLFLVLVVALALGLGVGLGLRKGNNGNLLSNPPTSVTGTPSPGAGPEAVPEGWRIDTKQYILDMNWDLNAAPTTRRYDLVIGEGQGWPDGKSFSPVRQMWSIRAFVLVADFAF